MRHPHYADFPAILLKYIILYIIVALSASPVGRMIRRGRSKKEGRPEFKKIASEHLVKRVFITSPRSFSFSHRSLCSIRHPFLAFVVECISGITSKGHKISALLEASLDAKDETERWNRAAFIFDSKIDSSELDLTRQRVILSPVAMMHIEAIWAALGGTRNGEIREDAYRYFHQRLYAFVFGVEDVSLQGAFNSVVSADFVIDGHGCEGVQFGPFAESVLEVADNWTKSRELSDYLDLLKGISTLMTSPRSEGHLKDSFGLSSNVFFSGGLLAKRNVGGHTEYVKLSH